MAISFIEKLEGMKMTSFEFTSFKMDVSSENEQGEKIKYLVFDLKEPKAEITGSNGEYDPRHNRKIHPVVRDVRQIRCNLELIKKYEVDFSFVEQDGELTGEGNYKGDMFLDVSRALEVWLVDVKFSRLSSEWRKEKRNERIDKWLK